MMKLYNGTTSDPAACSVAEFYKGKTIFITGGTGFVAKVLVEKLLRSCPDVLQIYMLIRSKKGQNAHDRLHQILCSPLFQQLRRQRPNDLRKVETIEGDIAAPSLGISIADREKLYHSVNVIFHSAATVKFDTKLKMALTTNLLGTQNLVKFCHKMTRLEALVHVSTAYSNCDRTNIEELIYPIHIDPVVIQGLVETLDEDTVDCITPQLLGIHPNTYTFTKALTESWLLDNHAGLPLVIVRPSIIVPSNTEPMRGWIDNWNGPTGLFAATGKGIFRTMFAEIDKAADLIPVDMVSNLMVVAAWRMGIQEQATTDITIYNCVSGLKRTITWKQFNDLCLASIWKYPFSEMVWYPNVEFTSSRLQILLQRVLMQYLPAYVLDTLGWMVGRKRIMVHIQSKLTKAAKTLEFFTTNEWNFDDKNVRLLMQTLSERDREEFCFDPSIINWSDFFEGYVLGIRRFLLNEELSTIEHARKKLRILYWRHCVMRMLLLVAPIAITLTIASRMRFR